MWDKLVATTSFCRWKCWLVVVVAVVVKSLRKAALDEDLGERGGGGGGVMMSTKLLVGTCEPKAEAACRAALVSDLRSSSELLDTDGWRRKPAGALSYVCRSNGLLTTPAWLAQDLLFFSILGSRVFPIVKCGEARGETAAGG